MLNAKHFATGTRRFLALPIVAAVLITTTISSSPVSLACPGPPPQPLRLLYKESALVVVARVGKSEKINVDKPESDEGATLLRTALLVSSTLKGEVQPVVYVNHWAYGEYKDQLSSVPEGDTLLLFLSTHQEDGGYFIDNMAYGVKKLSDADLAVYVDRIEELASIMKADKPTDAEIVEWLVRCAEEPATRWEGTYELAMSGYMLSSQQVQEDTSVLTDAEETPENQVADVSQVDAATREVEVSTASYESEYPGKPEFARLLTPDQKYRLTSAIINGKAVPERDYFLIDLVEKWDDPRLVPYLLSQLRYVDQADSYFTESLMTIIARKLGDDALIALVSRFSGSDSVESSEYEYQAPSDEGGDANGESDNASTPSAEQQEADRATAAQERASQLQYFITLAESTVQNNGAEKDSGASTSVVP